MHPFIFLIHLFHRLAKSYGLRLLFKENFHDYYNKSSRDEESQKLLERIGVIGGSSPEMSEEEWEAARKYS